MHLFQNDDYRTTGVVTDWGTNEATQLIRCSLLHSHTAELAELVSFCVFCGSSRSVSGSAKAEQAYVKSQFLANY